MHALITDFVNSKILSVCFITNTKIYIFSDIYQPNTKGIFFRSTFLIFSEFLLFSSLCQCNGRNLFRKMSFLLTSECLL